MKSLYKNVPETNLMKAKIKLLLHIHMIIIMCQLLTDKHFFTFKKFYKQKFGLTMDSSFSSILACHFLKFLESGPFRNIL